MFCPKCGTSLPNDAHFCSECGNPINANHMKRPESTGESTASNTPLSSSVTEPKNNAVQTGISANAKTDNVGNRSETAEFEADAAQSPTPAKIFKGKLPIIVAAAAGLIIIISFFSALRGSSRNDRETPAEGTYSSESSDTDISSSSEKPDTDISNGSEASAGEIHTLTDWYNSGERIQLEADYADLPEEMGMTFFVSVQEPDTLVFNCQLAEQIDFGDASREEIDAVFAQSMQPYVDAVRPIFDGFQEEYGIPLSVFRLIFLNADGTSVASMDFTKENTAAPGESPDTDADRDSTQGTDDSTGNNDNTPDTASNGGNTPASERTRLLVAEPLTSDPLNRSVTSDSVYIQDLVDFCDGALSYEPIDTSENYNVRDFSGTASDKAVLEAYVRALCDGNYNLALADEYEQSYGDTFFSWNLNYTGSGNVTASRGATFTDAVSTIEIYGIIKGNKMTAAVWIPQQMEQIDLGLRYGGQNEEPHIAGESAMAGLYKLSDGTFETTDGRLSTSPGQAVVMRDGTSYSTDATFNRDSELGRDELWVGDFYRNEMLFFCAPKGRLMTGDVYTLKDLIQEASWINKNTSLFKSASSFSDYNWTLFLGLGHDGDFITPLLADYSEFKELTVRVMYWDKDVEAVYYIYAELKSSPYIIEALCAVNLNGGKAAVQADETYAMYTGETLELSCPKAFVPNYELFTWEITEGDSLAELSGTESSVCTIKASKAGTVRVKVTYEYGIDEPDVLTGIPRNTNKTKTYEYLITIQSK